jgi:choline kinase
MTHALILAAGEGTRLRPFTNNKPKCLVELQGKSLLQRQVDTLNKIGINNIHIATGYCAEQIQQLGFATTFNPKFAASNMVTSMFNAIDFMLQSGDLIISYGDIVYQSDNINKLLNSSASISIMVDRQWRQLWDLRMDDPLSDAETLILDDENYIIELGSNASNYTQIQGQYTGLIKVRADKIRELYNFYNSLDRSVQYDGKDFANMYMTSFLQLLINNAWKVQAVLVDNGWLEVDSASDLEIYNKMAANNQLTKFYRMEDL